ncbi:MAG: hypothetical protein HY303_21130 [Candidatus Wallbacteria bacterium]|nr:hypothetical protein [Candidatus Wallbacteria bacterium]
MHNIVDSPERKKLIDEMVRIIQNEVPCILGVHRLGFRLAHKWLSDYKPHPLGYGFNKYYKVDPALREETKKNL